MTKLSYRILSFSQRLFLSVLILFLVFAICFIAFQYQREKAYKSELLNIQLQSYNNQLGNFITDRGELDIDSMQNYVATHMMPNLRVTLITPLGKVIYDNTQICGRISQTFGNRSYRLVFSAPYRPECAT